MRKGVLTMVLVMVLAVGCSGPSNSSSTTSPDGTGTSEPAGGGTLPPDTTATSEPTGEPAPEPTDPESTQTKQRKPAISIATAPVGGGPDDDGVEQCASVSWLAGDLPDGTTVTLGSITFEPAGIFELDQNACPDSREDCTGVVWKPGATDTCFVGARQVKNGDEDVTVIINASATCATEQDCQDLEKAAKEKGSDVHLSPGELPTTTSETPTTETPTTETSTGETPSASETPSSG